MEDATKGKEMSIVIGIDVGGSTTKIVGFAGSRLIQPLYVRATDPLASLYGAFGKFTAQNDIKLDEISHVMVCGVGSAYLNAPVYGIPTTHVSEFDATGRGGLYLSGLDNAVIVSMGTGTAIVHADGSSRTYLGGTGVGGGTVIGIAKKMIGVSQIDDIVALASDGDVSRVDLRLCDITGKNIIPTLPPESTAANFGKVSDVASPSDIALGILNMVYESIAMLAVFAARGLGINSIVLTGNLAVLPQSKRIFSALSGMFNVDFIIPHNARFATVIGAALEYGDACKRRQ